MLQAPSKSFLKNIPALSLALMAALNPVLALNVKVNFQPDASTLPAGYIKDIGQAYDAGRGYGWVTEASLSSPAHAPVNLTPNTRDRAKAGVEGRLNTLIQAQDPVTGPNRVNTRSAWEYAVPVGTYKVVVSVGDATYFDSRHYVRVEGASLISDFIGTAGIAFKRDSINVNVTDGRISVDGLGGSNTKFNYVIIESLDSPPGNSGEIRLENLDGVPYHDRLVFSRIHGGISTHKFHDVAVLRVHNDGPGALSLTALQFTVTGKWSLPNNDQAALPISIGAGSYRDIPVKFIETAGAKGIREGELVLGSDDPDESQVRVQLAGAFMTRPEGDNEVFNPDILKAFGYQVRMTDAGQTLSLPYLAAGEEIISTLWRRARPALPVTVRQLTAFHGCCTDQPLFEIVGAGGGTFRHASVYGQSFLPLLAGSATAPAALTLNPTGTFQFRIANYAVAPNSAGNRGVRIWPLRDREGLLVPDAYFVIQDYVNAAGSAANFDFNDNLYLVTNIQPESFNLNASVAGLYPGVPGLARDFNADYPGSLLDKDGLTTGFTKAQTNKNDRTNANASFLASALDKDAVAGTLSIATSAGTHVGSDNALVNGLTLPFDGRHTPFKVASALKGPFSNLNTFGRQAGIMLGSDQDHFIRMAAGVFAAGGAFSVQFQKEFAGVATTIGSVTVANPANLLTLELFLFGNPAAGMVTAAYNAIYAGSQSGLVFLPGNATVTGLEYARVFDRKSYGGIFAIHGPATPTAVAFDRFAVESDAAQGASAVRLINVAGPQYTALDGRVWGIDAGLFTPSNAQSESWGTPAVANTGDDILYHTYRANLGSSVPQAQRLLTFEIPVTSPTALLVKLHFAEAYFGAPSPATGAAGPGKRVFDVIAEGRTVLEDFDITAAAGGAVSAVVVPIEGVQVNDGNLTLGFKAEIDFGAIHAIEVLLP